VQNAWIFKGRRRGCPLYVYLEDEDAGGIRRTVDWVAGLHYSQNDKQRGKRDPRSEISKTCL